MCEDIVVEMSNKEILSRNMMGQLVELCRLETKTIDIQSMNSVYKTKIHYNIALKYDGTAKIVWILKHNHFISTNGV